jgi:hypothetical protein
VIPVRPVCTVLTHHAFVFHLCGSAKSVSLCKDLRGHTRVKHTHTPSNRSTTRTDQQHCAPAVGAAAGPSARMLQYYTVINDLAVSNMRKLAVMQYATNAHLQPTPTHQCVDAQVGSVSMRSTHLTPGHERAHITHAAALHSHQQHTSERTHSRSSNTPSTHNRHVLHMYCNYTGGADAGGVHCWRCEDGAQAGGGQGVLHRRRCQWRHRTHEGDALYYWQVLYTYCYTSKYEGASSINISHMSCCCTARFLCRDADVRVVTELVKVCAASICTLYALIIAHHVMHAVQHVASLMHI